MTVPHYAAERVIDELAISSLEDLLHLDLIAWARGAIVRENHLTGAEARITIAGKRAIITISTAITDPRRKRFSIAHELGHLEMHRYKSELTFCTTQDLNNWETRRDHTNYEQEANEFASALLLPERFFAQMCSKEAPSLNFISELANTFNVSLTATALRYLRFCNEPCAIIFSQDGYGKWFRKSKEFEDVGVFMEARGRLDPSNSVVTFFHQYTSNIPRMTPRRVSASNWFAPGKYREDATILEDSWAMPTYNAVITLLWIDEDIEDDDWWL
jgi:hypothetical protein